MDVGPSGQRFEQPPFRPGQVLEAVGEDRARTPRIEIAGEALDRPAPKRPAIPRVEPRKPTAICTREGRERLDEVVGLEQGAVELGEGRPAASAKPEKRAPSPWAASASSRSRTVRSASPSSRFPSPSP